MCIRDRELIEVNEELIGKLKTEIKGTVEAGAVIHGEVFLDEGDVYKRQDNGTGIKEHFCFMHDALKNVTSIFDCKQTRRARYEYAPLGALITRCV